MISTNNLKSKNKSYEKIDEVGLTTNVKKSNFENKKNNSLEPKKLQIKRKQTLVQSVNKKKNIQENERKSGFGFKKLCKQKIVFITFS
jgi:hypothetical protein